MTRANNVYRHHVKTRIKKEECKKPELKKKECKRLADKKNNNILIIYNRNIKKRNAIHCLMVTHILPLCLQNIAFLCCLNSVCYNTSSFLPVSIWKKNISMKLDTENLIFADLREKENNIQSKQ